MNSVSGQRMMTYLPWYYEPSRVMQAIQNANGVEVDYLWQALNEILDQNYVEKATWGLRCWEKELGISALPGDGFEDRRRRILSRLQSNQISTHAFMTALAQRYFPPDAAVEIKANTATYTFRVIADAATFDITGLIDAINTYKPAHLGSIITRLVAGSGSMNFGGVVQLYKKTMIKTACSFSAEIDTGQMLSGGVAQTSKILTIT